MILNGDLWLKQLSSALITNKQVAYIWYLDQDKIEFLGDTLNILGVSEGDAPKNKDQFTSIINPQDIVQRQLTLADIISRCSEHEAEFSLKYRVRHADGSHKPMIEKGSIRFDKVSNQKIIQSTLSLDESFIESITVSTNNVSQISYALSPNTGRQVLLQNLEQCLDTPDRDISRGYVLAIGIDRLSLINEAYGAQIADEVLIKTGKRLEALAGNKASITRVNGDLFTMFVPTGHHDEMESVANSILKVFYHQPLSVSGSAIHVMVSIGGVAIDGDNTKGAAIISRAELALREAKNMGRGCYVCYSDKLKNETNDYKDFLAVGDQFLKAYRDNRVKIAFQKIINSKTQDVSFHECLIRMISEDGKVIPAGMFINAIEKMGLTRLADNYCTQQAIAELKMFPDIALSVNVSNHTLVDPQWLRDVVKELDGKPDVASRLIVEITESVAMNDVVQTLRVINTLRGLGCRTALDDFGAGQTAFTQLRDLQLDIVKIDKSFVRNMDKNENMLFIQALQSLASGMKLETVGEGAETMAEADILAQGGIDHIQGYAYGMPTMERIWLPVEHSLRVPTLVKAQK